MAQLNFGAMTFTTSPERDRFAALRRRYLALGERHSGRFGADYPTFKTADDLFEGLPGKIEAALSETAAMVASDLAANGIFDVSEKSLRADLEARAEFVADRFGQVEDQYFAIIGKAAELEAQRQEARENRGRIVGGGFGVEGAARGIAIAAVANAAIGLTHGLVNLTAKAASNLGDREKKRLLLDDPATKAAIGDFFVRIALQGAELVAVTVAGGTTFETVSEEARQRSAAIIENVAAGRVPDDQVQSVLVQALTLDPFNAMAWTGWLDRCGDQNGSVQASAEALGIGEVNAHKARLIAERKASLSWATPEECASNSAILEQYAGWLEFSFDAERASIEARAAKLDRERRTFNSVEYASQAEVEQARRAHDDEVQRTVAGVVHDTHDEAQEARKLVREHVIAASTASTVIGWMTMSHRRYRDTAGRSCREEFLMFGFFVAAVVLGCMLIAGASLSQVPINSTMPAAGLIAVLFGLIFLFVSIIIALPLQIRRFHDQGRSGWFVLLNLIPYIGWLIVLAFMFVDGTPGDNRFGPSPKET